MSLEQQVIQAFQQRFGATPAIVVRAPGRVNLIGEHTDYNDGFVLPMAIDRGMWIALRPRPDKQVIIHSLDIVDTPASFSLDSLRNTGAGWAEYVKGVAWALQDSGAALSGWEGVCAGNVPIGSGLSSSAALELSTARAFSVVSDIPWDAAQMAKLSQRAENHWVGVNCGIMDQMISAAGQADHALLIDCRSLETQSVPLPSETVVVALDTATRRGLVDSSYNERRQQCETAAQFFGVPALRDVTLELFETQSGGLDDITRRRARHIITENARTLQAVDVMRRGDALELGLLMNASHTSLRDDFEVSSDALNMIVDCARQEKGCFGSRMTGAGFGGCAVALVAEDVVEAFTRHVSASYNAASGLSPQIYVSRAAAGAEVIRQG